jgi:signal transduction histidine kinase
MKKSLTLRLIFWNSVFLLIAMGLFGWLQLLNTQRTVVQMVDRELAGRANSVPPNIRLREEDGGRQGPPDGFGQRDGRRQGQGGPPQDRNPWRRPRIFDSEGNPIGPDENSAPLDDKALERGFRGEVVFLNKVIEGTELRIGSFPRRDRGQIVGVTQVAQELQPFQVANEAQAWSLLMIIPLTGLVSVGLVSILARGVVKPITKLTSSAERIAANPNLHESLEVSGEDEIARMTQSFNAMTLALQNANDQISQSLERQQRFTSDAAHELRTPLTSASIAAENGLHPSATPVEQRQSLETVLRSCDSMNRLTGVLLTLARLDQADAQLEWTNVLLAPIVEEVLREAEATNDPRIKLAFDQTDVLWSNPDGLKQIIRNLVENALAYTPRDGQVRVSVTENQLQVKDTGAGIASEHISKLFDRFYRGDSSRDRQTGGHGLGLAIVKALADAMGATIKVESKIGSGTTFFVEFAKNPKSS